MVSATATLKMDHHESAQCFPRLRENIWHIGADAKPEDNSYLVTSKAQYEIPASYTMDFLKIRPFCTGHHSVAEIADCTGVSEETILAFIKTFEEIGLVYLENPGPAVPDVQEVRDTLLRITELWAQELHSVYIANELVRDKGLSKDILVGWLIEMYHYVHDFPHALQHGARHATGNLRTILDRYATEELGHEHFVLQSLVNLGLNAEAVKNSVPLVSTRTIGLLMRELLEMEPAATLLAAALLEAADFDEKNIDLYKKRLSALYGIAENALDPYFKHQKIDYDLGHQKLLADNLQLVEMTDMQKLDEVVNKLHDLKHAFELQSAEIKAYYGAPLNGRYIPRQRMTYQSI